VSDTSNEKKVAETGSEAVPPAKRKSIVPFAVAIIIILLTVFVVMSFLSAQKAHKQMVELGRRITALQESGDRISGRVLAVEEELMRRSLKQRRSRLTRSLRALQDLKPLLRSNRQLAAQVDGLMAALGNEKKQLELELCGDQARPVCPGTGDTASASTPCLQNGSQPCPCPQAGSEACPKPVKAVRTECSNGVCRLVPATAAASGPVEAGAYALVPAAPQHPEISAGGGHGADGSVKKPKIDNWWSRFINLRIFGGN